jgi:hypothetical protein
MAQDRMKTVLRDRISKSSGGATQIREMANIFDTMFGIPLPPMYLALQYLIGVDVIPLGRTITLVGPPGSGKSVFGWWISTLFAQNDGFVAFVDAEDKTSWDQVDGVYRGQGLNCQDWFWRQHPTSQEQMFEHLTIFQQELLKVIKDEKGGAYGAPIMFFVDSINYLSSGERVKKRVEQNDQGAVGFAHAHKANNLTEYLQSFVPNAVSSWPATLVTINHQKTKMDPEGSSKGGKSFGAPEKYEPGGVHKDFMYSLNIELAKGAKGMAPHTRDVRKKSILLKTKKSCFAEEGRRIALVMETRQAAKEDGSDGISVEFDWGRALVDLLAKGTKGWGDGEAVVAADALEGVLELSRTSKTACDCKTFGMQTIRNSTEPFKRPCG